MKPNKSLQLSAKRPHGSAACISEFHALCVDAAGQLSSMLCALKCIGRALEYATLRQGNPTIVSQKTIFGAISVDNVVSFMKLCALLY